MSDNTFRNSYVLDSFENEKIKFKSVIDNTFQKKMVITSFSYVSIDYYYSC